MISSHTMPGTTVWFVALDRDEVRRGRTWNWPIVRPSLSSVTVDTPNPENPKTTIAAIVPLENVYLDEVSAAFALRDALLVQRQQALERFERLTESWCRSVDRLRSLLAERDKPAEGKSP